MAKYEITWTLFDKAQFAKVEAETEYEAYMLAKRRLIKELIAAVDDGYFQYDCWELIEKSEKNT